MDLHVGEIVKKVADKKKVSLSDLAISINTGKRNMYKLAGSNDMYVSQLYKISKSLGHNFFKDLSAVLERDLQQPLEMEHALFNEPAPTYKKKGKQVTIKFEVQYDIANADNLGRFMMYVDSVSEKLGFKIL